VVRPAQLTLTTQPVPSSITLGKVAPIIEDTITLTGAYFPTGDINVTLKLGSTTVDTFRVPAANGTLPAGAYFLPTTVFAASSTVLAMASARVPLPIH
jgi:hypothetical protein